MKTAWDKIREATTVEEMRAAMIEELRHRAWQERAAASIGRTNKQRTAEAECAAKQLEILANHLEADAPRVIGYRCATCHKTGPEHGHYDATDPNTHKFTCGEPIHTVPLTIVEVAPTPRRSRLTLELPAQAAAKLAAMTPGELAELSAACGVTVQAIETHKPDSTESDDDAGRTRCGNTPPPEEGESTPCDECGADIPDSERSCINSSHSPACSLYPANARD